MNHLFLTDAELTAVQTLAFEALSNLNKQCVMLAADPLSGAERYAAQDSMTLLTRIAGQCTNPLHGYFASETAIKHMTLKDLRERHRVVHQRGDKFRDFGRIISNEIHTRFRDMRDGQTCGICEDTSGQCEHRDLDLHRFIDAFDEMRDELSGVAA